MIDIALNCFYYIPWLKKLSDNIKSWATGLVEYYVDLSADVFLDGKSDRDQLEESVDATVAAWEAECAEIEAKHQQVRSQLLAEHDAKINAYHQSMKESQGRALSDYRHSIGAFDVKVGPNLDLQTLQKLWSSCPTPKAIHGEEKFHAILDALVDEVLAAPEDFKFKFPGSEKPLLVNPLVWDLVSPVFRSLEDVQVTEISRDRMQSLSNILNQGNRLSDVITAFSIADYFCMSSVLEKLQESIDLEIQNLKGDAAVAVFVSACNSSMHASPPSVSLSEIDDSALDCLSPENFHQLVNGRKFSKRVDLVILEKFKNTTTNFQCLDYIDVDNLHAAVLPDCERILNAHDYATLLTLVLSNIERENLRLSKLSEKRGKTTPPPERNFRYSVN